MLAHTLLRRTVGFGTATLSSSSPFASSSSRRSLQYKAPIKDILFTLNEVHDGASHYERLGYTEVNEELVEMLVGEAGKFCENVLAPLNEVGDKQGCSYDGKSRAVKTPDGFKEAYEEYMAGGWQGLTVPEAYGGQGLPLSIGMIKAEMIGQSNWSWGMYPGLAVGAMNTLLLHGSEAQKQQYLTKLAEGTWLGTMCLTEPHCGTDLGQCKTRAEPQPDGSYRLNGTKIFISCGEHDMTENIVHIVLARLPDAPAGTRGISLFVAPKYLPAAGDGDGDGGALSAELNVSCGGLESKMGIHGSATSIMNFDDSVGWMIGEPNAGLQQMFTFMNTARIGTAVQGQAAAEQAYQLSLPYAHERTSLRSLAGKRYPDRVADPLIVHPDIRRMLLTQRAIAEGGRALIYHTSLLGDAWLCDRVADADRADMDDYLGLFTPIAKGFLTELGCEAASLGMQIWGGHGYIAENGLEQVYRDARISTLYEGTTGIQALDLLGRKVLLNNGKLLNRFVGEIRSLCLQNALNSDVGKWSRSLLGYSTRWLLLTARIARQHSQDKNAVNAACVDYLMYSGYVTLGYFWLRIALAAQRGLAAGTGDAKFYQQKLDTAEFYFAKLMPRANSHRDTIISGPESLMKIQDQDFHLPE
jgi:3-(methylsulfanyl)propanoyl-CoA dehydrogenase